jgi:hypothetical protein
MMYPSNKAQIHCLSKKTFFPFCFKGGHLSRECGGSAYQYFTFLKNNYHGARKSGVVSSQR